MDADGRDELRWALKTAFPMLSECDVEALIMRAARRNRARTAEVSD